MVQQILDSSRTNELKKELLQVKAQNKLLTEALEKIYDLSWKDGLNEAHKIAKEALSKQ